MWSLVVVVGVESQMWLTGVQEVVEVGGRNFPQGCWCWILMNQQMETEHEATSVYMYLFIYSSQFREIAFGFLDKNTPHNNTSNHQNQKKMCLIIVKIMNGPTIGLIFFMQNIICIFYCDVISNVVYFYCFISLNHFKYFVECIFF